MLQGRVCFAVSIYNMMQDLYASLISGRMQDFFRYMENLLASAVQELKAKFVDALDANSDKLDAYLYLQSGNPLNKLFKVVRIFDPH